jgi:uncharacterized NAD-dependent epimerase/dehydratase family protein
MIAKPYLLFLGDVQTDVFAKTAFGLRDWCKGDVVGQWRLPTCRVDLGINELDAGTAAAAGARSMVVAVASIGGALPQEWVPSLIAALEAGLDLVSGMHARLRDIPEVVAAATRLGRRLHDVRHADRALPIATGKRRTGKRLLTVGTDCSVGKKYTALALARELQARGLNADFRATGQTGIMIAGDGIAIDAVVADFIAGAAEQISPEAAPDHWDVIEGQGSLFHPAYAGVTLGLLHGSQADALVLCHDPTRVEVNGFPGYPIKSLTEALAGYLTLARLTNSEARFVGVSLNTAKLATNARAAALADASAETGLPACDPMQDGVGAIADLIEAI